MEITFAFQEYFFMHMNGRTHRERKRATDVQRGCRRAEYWILLPFGRKLELKK
jgi:hypothetical protein